MLKCIGLSKRRRKKDGKRSNFIKHSWRQEDSLFQIR
jgi:hypothetical protein